MGGMMAKMSTGEMLMNVGAAWIFVVAYVIGNRIASDYGSNMLVTISFLALVVLTTTYLSKSGKVGGLGSIYPWAATAATWGILVFAALDLLNGLANSFSSSGEFYEITIYIAAAIGAAGAYMQGQGN